MANKFSASLSDLRQQYLTAISILKKKRAKTRPEKSGTEKSAPNAGKLSLPAEFGHRDPDLSSKLLAVHLKKIEFYLSFTKEFASEFEHL